MILIYATYEIWWNMFKNIKKIINIKILFLAIVTIFIFIGLINQNFYIDRGEFKDCFEKCDGPSSPIEGVPIADVKLMIKNNYQGEFKDKKIVFLTFDDGPSVNTDRILDVLEEKQVKATFFVVGKRLDVATNKERLKRIYREGHGIGNHSYSHDFSKIYKNNKVQVDCFINEIKQTEEVIESIIGKRDKNSIVIRMPGGYGSRKYYNDPNLPELNERFLEENIYDIDWNSLNGDAEKRSYTKDEMINYVRKTAKGKQYIVVLMHDKEGKDKTVEMLPEMIDYFINDGYEFKIIN